jgi:hypothetical protein
MAFLVDTVTIDHRSTFRKIWDRFMVHCEIVGYSRAAATLAAHGMHEEAKELMMEVAKLKR